MDKKAMRTKGIRLLSVVTFALLIAGAVQAQQVGDWEMKATVGTTDPHMQFQSTSSMNGFGSSYSSNPTIGADGTADYYHVTSDGTRATRSGGVIKRSKEENEDPGITDDMSSPVGDGIWALLALAAAYGSITLIRRKRRAVNA